jgi:hypothetical protein
MERTDIFRTILETEHKARIQYEEAVETQEGLEKFLQEKEAALRAEYFNKAESELAVAREKYTAMIDESIKKIKVKQERDILHIHSSFDKKIDEWVDQLFEIVVGNA